MKKKALLTGAIIWGVIAVAILAIFVLGLTGNLNIPGIFTNGGTSVVFASNTKLVKEESFSVSGLEEIEIGTSYHDIIVNLVDDDKITVRQYDADSDNLFTAQQSGKTFNIKIQPRTLVSFMSFNFSPRLEIDLPESYAAEMALSTSSGSINCSDQMLKWGDTTVSTSSGTIRLNGGIACGVLEISSGSGSVNMGDAQAAQMSVTTNSGTIRLSELASGGNISLKSGSGSINTEEISASELSVKTNSGTIRLGEMNVTGAVTLDSGSGSINSDGMSVKTVDVSSNSGTLRLGDISADDSVSISSGSGSHGVGSLICKSYEISSNSGTLNYDGISGYGNIKTGSGSITCKSLDIKGSGSITSNSGTVRLDLSDNQNFEINISTNSGSIRTGDLDLMYKNQKGDDAFGTIGNGANGTLDIKTGSGSINIG